MKKIELSDKQIEEASKILNKHKTYAKFSKEKEDAFAFTAIIGVKICPYCNINYISTIFSKNKEILRPDIDHYFCKSNYHHLQLCLFNLIPSCLTCNERLKKDEDFMVIPHLHPYFHDFDSIMCFRVDLKKSAEYLDEDNLEILFVSKSDNKHFVKRAKNNIETFKLKERYQIHTDQVVDLFKKAKYYHKAKKDEINRLLYGNSDNSDEDKVSNLWGLIVLKQVLFPEKECDINQVSLGKLKKDIINHYCMI